MMVNDENVHEEPSLTEFAKVTLAKAKRNHDGQYSDNGINRSQDLIRQSPIISIFEVKGPAKGVNATVPN